MFSKQRKAAIRKYSEFVMAGIGLTIWGKVTSQVYLGSDEFVEQSKKKLVGIDEQLSEVPHKQTRPTPKPLSFFVERYANSRDKGIAEAYRSGGYSMKSVASEFGVHYSTVSRVCEKLDLTSKRL